MRTADATGMALSGLCLVHCLALPALISLAPALFWMQDERVHLALAVLATLVTLLAMRRWPRDARGPLMKACAVLGLGLLFYGALAEVSEDAEQTLTVTGALLLASAHAAAWIFTSLSHAHRHR